MVKEETGLLSEVRPISSSTSVVEGRQKQRGRMISEEEDEIHILEGRHGPHFPLLFGVPVFLSLPFTDTHMDACTLQSNADLPAQPLLGSDAGKGLCWVAAGQRER